MRTITRRNFLTTGAAALASMRRLQATTPLYYLGSYGQSNAIGTTGATHQILTTAQPSGYNNFALRNTGQLDPLVGGENGADTEIHVTAMGHQFTYMCGGGTSRQCVTYPNGSSGAPYSTLARTPAIPAAYSTGANEYKYLPQQISAAKSSATSGGYSLSVPSFVFIHGEADLGAGTSAAQYAADMVELQAAITFDAQAITGQSTQVALVLRQLQNRYSGAGVCLGYPTSNPTGDTSPIGQWIAARDNANIYLGGPRYHVSFDSSGLHHDPAGHLQNGEELGIVLYRILVQGSKTPSIAPRSITRSGANITARFWVPTGSLTTDFVTLAQKPNGLGFEYWNDQGSRAWNAPIIPTVDSVSGDTVTMHLASTPSGFSAETLRFAWLGGTGGNGFTSGNIRSDTGNTGVISGVTRYDWMPAFNEPLPFAWNPTTTSLFPLPSPVAH